MALGGVIMWVVGDLAFLAGMAAVVTLWVRHEDRRTERLDRRLAAEHASRAGRIRAPPGVDADP